MSTLHEAATQALESLQELNGWQSLAPPAASSAAVQAAINLRAVLAEPVQEPPTDWEAVAADQAMTIAMLRSEEPVAWMVYTLDGKSVCVTDNPADFTDKHRVLPLYAAPPQRMPLPQAEIERLYITAKTPMAFARSIERAHGITS